MQTLRCVIVDDQQDAIEDLTSLLTIHARRMKIAGTARTYSEALRVIKDSAPDVLFLDVELGAKTGFDVLQALPSPRPVVVFVSAMAHYSLRAIKVSAADYLLKPVDATELAEVIDKCAHQNAIRLNQEATSLLASGSITVAYRPQHIALRQQDSLRLVPIENLIYVEGDSNYSRFHTTTGDRITASLTLKDVEEMVDPKQFMRCHKSYLVNRLHVAELRGGDLPEIMLLNGNTLPVARRRLKDIKHYFSTL